MKLGYIYHCNWFRVIVATGLFFFIVSIFCFVLRFAGYMESLQLVFLL